MRKSPDKIPNPTGKGGFTKGISGNPLGKSKQVLEFQRHMQEHAAEAIGVLLDVLRNGKNTERLAAAQEILNRAYGKPVHATVNTQVKSFEAMLDLLAASNLPPKVYH